MLVQVLSKVPQELLDGANSEVNHIRWDQVIDPIRQKSAVFDTSISLHLRHLSKDQMTPELLALDSVEHISTILDCETPPLVPFVYKQTLDLVNWIVEQVDGVRLGRVMIVRVAPHGVVGLHIDPNLYFETYSRFHIPLKTNANVLFSGGEGTEKEHMPQGYLSRLNNRLPHMMENNSDEYRIHIIADIQTPTGNQIF